MIYAIHAIGTEYVKFGVTGKDDVMLRLGALQTGCPHELVLLACAQWIDSDERRIHRHLKQTRIRGEWYLLNDKAKHVIESMQQGKEGRRQFIDAFLARTRNTRLNAVLAFAKAIGIDD